MIKRVVERLESSNRIRYYYYVYEQYRIGDRVITRYIGRLDEIVELYLKMSEWTGRDLNPGPPGCKPGALPG